MNKLLALSFLFILSSQAFAATKFSIGAALNLNSVETEDDKDLKGFHEELTGNPAIAGRVHIDMNEKWLFRTGLWFQEKSAGFSYDRASTEGEIIINTIYTSIPLTFQYKAHESVSVFGGYIADLRINDYCNAYDDFDDCPINKESESIVHVATLGVNVNVNNWLDMEVGWQHGLTDVAEDSYKIHSLQIAGFYKF